MPDDLQRIFSACKGGRSPLYRYLRCHHDSLCAAMDGERPDWSALAVEFARLGLGGTVEQPMKSETVRHCWHRVRRDLAKARARRKARVIVPVASTRAPDSPPSVGSSDVLADLQRQLDQRSGRR